MELKTLNERLRSPISSANGKRDEINEKKMEI